MIDQHFTPPLLASLLIDSLPVNFQPSRIADFAVGEGSLIQAALKRWSQGIEVIANDVCHETLELLHEKNWNKFNINFLDSNAIFDSGLYRFEKKIDLILLNPPFSQRGLKPILWEGLEVTIKSGLALNFIYKSLSFLKPGGFLVAVVPNGSLTSNRDKAALSYLKKNYIFSVIAKNEEKAFQKVNAKTSIILIENKAPPKKIIQGQNLPTPFVFKVLRGKLQMHKIKSLINDHGTPLIHTTNLKNNVIHLENTVKVNYPISKVKGPAILIPRVGNFNKDKICLLSLGLEVVISDCIFAVPCQNEGEAINLQKKILEDWSSFKENYSGTGAIYSTLEKIEDFINRINYKAYTLNKSYVA